MLYPQSDSIKLMGALINTMSPQEPITTGKVSGRTLFFLMDNGAVYWVLTQSLGHSLRREQLPKVPQGPVPTLGTPLGKETLDTVLNSFFSCCAGRALLGKLGVTNTFSKKKAPMNQLVHTQPHCDLLFSEEKKMAGKSTKEWERLTLSYEN